MAKAYVLVKIGFEYNDEVYHQTEEHFGEPILVFHNKTRAEEECLQNNIAAIKSTNWEDFLYDSEELVDLKHNIWDVCQIFGVEDLKDIDTGDLKKMFKKLNNDQLGVIADMLSIKFYRVDEVDVAK